MSTLYLVALVYSAAALFMASLCLGIGIVTALRRMRLASQEQLLSSNATTLQSKLYMVHSPQDDIWATQSKTPAATVTSQATRLPPFDLLPEPSVVYASPTVLSVDSLADTAKHVPASERAG